MRYEMAQVLNNLAGAYLQLGMPEEAQGYYQSALEALQGLDAKDLRGQIENKLTELREL